MLNPERKSITSCISWSVGRFIPLSTAEQPFVSWGPPGPTVPDRLPDGRSLGNRLSCTPGTLTLSSELLLGNRQRDG
ncbi:hypothetical protein AGIG_G11998, partial [Arapaima gigas]